MERDINLEIEAYINELKILIEDLETGLQIAIENDKYQAIIEIQNSIKELDSKILHIQQFRMWLR